MNMRWLPTLLQAGFRDLKPTVYRAKCVELQCRSLQILPKDFANAAGPTKRATYIAEGSIEECRYYLILAEDLGYGQTAALMSLLEEVSRLINAYARAILASDS